MDVVQLTPLLQQIQGFQNGDMIFVGRHLRHRQQQEVLLTVSKRFPLGLPVKGQIPELFGADTHTGNIFDPLGTQLLQRPGMVFLVDRNQYIRHRRQQPLRRVEQQPVQ